MLSQEKIVEYQQLRTEYGLLTQVMTSTVNFSVIGCIGLFGLVIIRDNFLFFFLPLLIVYPACYLLISRIQSVLRLSAYIIVFIEPHSEIGFETRLQQVNKKSKFKFSTTVLWIYLGILMINIAIYWSKGFSSIIYLSFYGLSVLPFIHVYYLMKKNWRGIFIKRWTEVKKTENTES